MNILVTGCGDDIGQSIGKILKENFKSNKVIGSDMSSQNASYFIYDKLYEVEAVNSPNYQAQIKEIVAKEKISLIIPSCEPELRYHTKMGVTNVLFGNPILMANIEARELGFNKFDTVQFLKENNLPYPKTKNISDANYSDIPVIFKDREGSGSKLILIPKNEDEFNFYKLKYSSFISQELLNEDSEEYTCGLFRSKSGEVRNIIYKRKLTNGYSSFGEVVINSEVTDLLVEVANKLNLKGSINVQLKLSSKGPCIFEINPRFSSTVLFRHKMGFKDLIWSIEDFLDLPISLFSPPSAGIKFYKGFVEYIE